MKWFSSHIISSVTPYLLGLGASTLLVGCFEKDGKGNGCTPKGVTYNVAVTVVDLSKTTGCGLALHLADNTYLVPTGSMWKNFHATAGQKLLVDYIVKKKAASTCTAGPTVKLRCISLNTTTATTGGAN